MTEPRLVGRIDESLRRRIFGFQESHPMTKVAPHRPAYTGQWPSWLKAFEDQCDHRLKAAMLKSGIVLSCSEKKEHAFEALCFYLALADSQGGDCRYDLHAGALAALMKHVFREESLLREECTRDERFVDALLYFFACWPEWRVVNANIPLIHMPSSTPESRELHDWIKQWARGLWENQRTSQPLIHQERRNHLLVLLVRMRCFGMGPRDLQPTSLNAEDVAWLRQMHETLMSGSPLEWSLLGRNYENTYLAYIVVLAEAAIAARKSAPNPFERF